MTKSITNVETELQLDETRKITHGDLLMTVLNRPVPEGITLAEMRKSLKLIGKVETLIKENEVELTEEDLKIIKDSVNKHIWVAVHPEIVKFGDYIESL